MERSAAREASLSTGASPTSSTCKAVSNDVVTVKAPSAFSVQPLVTEPVVSKPVISSALGSEAMFTQVPVTLAGETALVSQDGKGEVITVDPSLHEATVNVTTTENARDIPEIAPQNESELEDSLLGICPMDQ